MPLFLHKKEKLYIHLIFFNFFIHICIKKTLYNIEKNVISVRSFSAENGKM